MKRSASIQALLLSLIGLHLISAAETSAVQIDNMLVSAVTTNSATLNWDSTEAYTAWIEYGPTVSYGNSTSATGLEYFSQVDLTGLSAGSPYHFRIHAADYLDQETISQDYAFTTRTQAEMEAAIRAARADGGLPKTYFVKTDGDDTNDGLSEAAAWKSLAQAVAQADAGDTIYLLPGTWTDAIINFKNPGIDIAPITLAGAYAGVSGTVLDSTLTTLTAISCSKLSYINIRDLYIRTYGTACYIHNSTHINVTRVTSENSFQDGMILRPTSAYLHFDQVVIDTTGEGYHGIHSQGVPDTALLDHLRFTRCSVTASHHNGIDLHNNNHYVSVADSTFDKVTNSAAVFSHNYNNRCIMVRDCTFLDGNRRGVWIAGTDNGFVYRNTFISTGTYGVLLYRPDGVPPNTDRPYYPGSHNILLKDNTFLNFGAYQYDIFMLNEADESDTLSELLFIGNSLSNRIVFEGPGIKNAWIVNPPNASTTIKISKNTVDGASVYFFNNYVFSENTPNEPVYSNSQSELSLAGMAGTYTIQTYPMAARPVSERAKIQVNLFDESLAKGQVLVDFNAETALPTQIDFIIGRLNANANYLVQRDGADYHVVQANANQCIAFSNAEGTPRRFTITESDQAADLITPAAATLTAGQWSVPLPPRNLTAMASNRKTLLTWEPPFQVGLSPVTHYNVYRATSSGRETLMKQSDISLTCVDPNIRHGETYYYQVSAVSASGESALSNEAAALGIHYPGAENQICVYPNPYIKNQSGNNYVVFANLPQATTLRIYTLAGVLLQTFEHFAKTPGGSVEWNVSGIAGGVYLYTATYSGGSQKGKLCLVK